MVSVAIFLNMGLVMTVPTWLPVYGLIEGSLTKEDTTVSATLYWIMNVLGKLIVAAWTAKTSIKLTYTVVIGLGCGLICLILHSSLAFGFVVNFGSLVYGLMFSSGLGLLLALPQQYGIFFKAEQTAHIMLWTLLAYGILTGLGGWMMQIEPIMILYWLLILNAGLLVVLSKVLKEMSTNSEGKDALLELKEVLAKD